MPNGDFDEKSLQDDILRELFGQLSKHAVFDPETLEKLNELRKLGYLKKPAKVSEAIKPIEEAQA